MIDLPKIITIAWIWNHAHYSLWLKLGAFIFAVFMFGVQFGHSDTYNKVTETFKPIQNKEVKK